MEKEMKDRWISDLRSGNFPQARKLLNSDLGYCCMGVLAEQLVELGLLSRIEDGYGIAYLDSMDEKSVGSLQYGISQKIGLPMWSIDNLIAMNDGKMGKDRKYKCYTFIEIADWIEENL